jgi:hypothetical protein
LTRLFDPLSAYVAILALQALLGSMTKKIVKPKGVEPDEIESKVANELYNLEVSWHVLCLSWCY